MKHVIWREGTGGPGIEKARAFLRGYFDIAGLAAMASRKGDSGRDLPATGAFDPDLRGWVRQFQASFNSSREKTAVRLRILLKGLPDNGDIDWRTRLVMKIDEKLADDAQVMLPDGVVAKQSPLTPDELKVAPPPGERYIGNAYRVHGLDRLLAALGLSDRKVNSVSDKRIALLDGPLMVPDTHALYRKATEASECAALVQALGVPGTERWQRGPHVQDIAYLAPGTVIATLGTGVYLSDYSGKSHVGIFLWKTDKALVMLDQFKGGDGKGGIRDGKVAIRVKPFNRGSSELRVKASRYIKPDYGYRKEFIDKDGNKSWRHDYSLKTVMVKMDLTSDGSEYYVLLDDGTVARRDSRNAVQRTAAENKQAAHSYAEELFEGVDVAGSKEAGAKLRQAIEGLRAAPAAPPLQPR